MKKLISFIVLLIMVIGSAQTVVSQTVNITTNPNDTICASMSVSLTANTSGGIVQTRVWTDNLGNNYGGTASINVTPATTRTFTVTVTFLGPIVRVATQVMTVNPTPTANITAGGSTTFCSGNSVTFNSTTTGGVTSYQWRLNGGNILGANGPSYTASPAGSYDLVVSNGACSGTSNALSVTVNPLPPATVTPNGAQQICFGSSITLTANAGYTYQWQNSPNGQAGTWTSIPGATNQTYIINTTGWYRARTTDGNGCQNYSN